MTCGIYYIECISNGKKYIGSAKKIEARWKSHLNKLKHNMGSRLLQEDYNIYGEENFKFTILEEVENNDDLLIERENFYMNVYKTYIHQYGYDYGYNLNRANRYKFSDKAKESMSKALKGKNILLSLEECLEIKELLLNSKCEMIKDKIKEVSSITNISERMIGKISRGECWCTKELQGGYKDWIGFNKYNLYVKIKEELNKNIGNEKIQARDKRLSIEYNVSQSTVLRLRLDIIKLENGKIIIG